MLFEQFRQVRKSMHGMGGRRHHPMHRGMHCAVPEGPGMSPENRMPFPGPEGPMRPHRRLPRERILTLISEASEAGLHQKELVARLGINPSSVSELTDKLETDGYITRNADPADKRATLITLTEKGRARAFEVADERAEMLQNMFKNLTAEEKQTLLGLLNKLTAGQQD